MAENEDGTEKTEDPSGKKLGDAAEKGQFPKSQEVNNWVMMAGAGIMLVMFAGDLIRNIAQLLLPFLESPQEIDLSGAGAGQLYIGMVTDLAVFLAPLFAFMVVLAIGGNLVQHMPVFATDKLKPKLSSISPMKGLKNKFSLSTLTEFGKGLVKLIVIGIAVILTIVPELSDLPNMVRVDVGDLLGIVKRDALIIITLVVVIMAAVAVVDVIYQRFKHHRDLRMTKQEVKDENKQMDGDPAVKKQLARIRFERARERMMAAVPNADVVITNPTHYAVALKYDQETMEAPVVVAKGQDLIALRIREVAEENKVAIVENPPLARGLFSAVEIDQPIPLQFYKTVAEVIGYVMRLKGGPGQHRRPPPPHRDPPSGPGHA